MDHQNPHSFEAEDLQKLILSATKDLEELDQKRREDFKQYEMEKELQYRESLNNMTDDQRKETIRKHDELQQKHREHPRVHHPGSKKQLEQVWEEQDHMPKEEFNPKVGFDSLLNRFLKIVLFIIFCSYFLMSSSFRNSKIKFFISYFCPK